VLRLGCITRWGDVQNRCQRIPLVILGRHSRGFLLERHSRPAGPTSPEALRWSSRVEVSAGIEKPAPRRRRLGIHLPDVRKQLSAELHRQLLQRCRRRANTADSDTGADPQRDRQAAYYRIKNFGKWLSFPSRLGEVLLPPGVPEVAVTRSAATVQSMRSDAVATTAPAVAGLAITAETAKPVAAPNRREQGSAQRATATAPPAVVVSEVADTTLSAASPITTVAATAASDASDTPSVPESISAAIGTTADGKTAESASTEAISPSASATKTASQKPSRQRAADKTTASSRAGRAAEK
jgi:hypothetical protein